MTDWLSEWVSDAVKTRDAYASKNIANETKENIKKDVEEGIKRIKFDIEENVVNLKDENGKQIATSENLKGISQH